MSRKFVVVFFVPATAVICWGCGSGPIECEDGYIRYSGGCIPELDCGENAQQVGRGCYCNTNFTPNSEEDACVLIECGDYAHLDRGNCYCNDGFYVDEDHCVAYDFAGCCGCLANAVLHEYTTSPDDMCFDAPAVQCTSGLQMGHEITLDIGGVDECTGQKCVADCWFLDCGDYGNECRRPGDGCMAAMDCKPIDYAACCNCLVGAVPYGGPCFDGPASQCTGALEMGLEINIGPSRADECTGQYCVTDCWFLTCGVSGYDCTAP